MKHPMVGKLCRLTRPTMLHLKTLPEGTLLLVVDKLRVGKKGAIDYFVLLNGGSDRIPDYWGGWDDVEDVSEAR